MTDTRTPPRAHLAIAFGAAGAVCAFALVAFGETSDLNYVWINAFGLVPLAGLCAAFAGVICARLFGHAGLWGWAGAFIGGVLATTIGAMVAGTFLVPGVGSLMAPMVLIWNGITYPIIGVIWLSLMAGIQYWCLYSKD